MTHNNSTHDCFQNTPITPPFAGMDNTAGSMFFQESEDTTERIFESLTANTPKADICQKLNFEDKIKTPLSKKKTFSTHESDTTTIESEESSKEKFDFWVECFSPLFAPKSHPHIFTSAGKIRKNEFFSSPQADTHLSLLKSPISRPLDFMMNPEREGRKIINKINEVSMSESSSHHEHSGYKKFEGKSLFSDAKSTTSTKIDNDSENLITPEKFKPQVLNNFMLEHQNPIYDDNINSYIDDIIAKVPASAKRRQNMSSCSSSPYSSKLSTPERTKPKNKCTSGICKNSKVIRKRKRKSGDQLHTLLREFERNPNWSKDTMAEVAQKTGLSEAQVYKWGWDQKRKIMGLGPSSGSQYMMELEDDMNL